ncbi:MAG: hypothetical protein KGM16_01105 [Bacteroidota bacterium]|nr:hypothetical protein [Bacteroidota bacterium]
MPALIFTITGFVACSAIIIYSGARLSKYGDIITNLTGIGKAWFGLILMSTVTSCLSFLQALVPFLLRFIQF